MNKTIRYTLKVITGFSLMMMFYGFSHLLKVVVASSYTNFIFINDLALVDQFFTGLIFFVGFGWVVLIGFFIEIKLKLVS